MDMVSRFVGRGLVLAIVGGGWLLMLASMRTDAMPPQQTTGRLIAAACNGDVAAATRLWEREVSRLSPDERSAALAVMLHTGATMGQPDIVRLALDRGADPDAMTSKGSTALMMAGSTPHAVEVARMLLDAGASVNLEDELGDTALTVAACEGQAELVALLLRAGADPAHANRAGRTVASLARFAGHDELAGSLESSAASFRSRSIRAGSLATNQPTLAR
jgi:ankyrin repeat protein